MCPDKVQLYCFRCQIQCIKMAMDSVSVVESSPYLVSLETLLNLFKVLFPPV